MVKITFQTVSSQKPEKETDGDHIVIPHVSWHVRSSLFDFVLCECGPLVLLQPRSSSEFSAEMVRFVMHRHDNYGILRIYAILPPKLQTAFTLKICILYGIICLLGMTSKQVND